MKDRPVAETPIIRRYAIDGTQNGVPFDGFVQVDGNSLEHRAEVAVRKTLRFEDGRVREFEGRGEVGRDGIEARGRETEIRGPRGRLRMGSIVRLERRLRREGDDPVRAGFVQSVLRCSERKHTEADGHLRCEWTSEDALTGPKVDEIDRYFARGEFGSFLGADGVQISHVTFRARNELGALVISNGRSQTYRTYAEMVYDLRHSGLTIHLLDHRGQGHSQRILDADAPATSAGYQRGHVECFDHYVADFETFLERVVRPCGHARTFALGHSMGGGILTLHAQRNPGQFDAIALSAPLHQLNEPWYLPLFLRGDPTRYASEWLYGAWQPGQGRGLCTTSGRRRELADAVFTRYPEVRIGGPTVGWIRAARKATQEMRDNASRLADPVLVIRGTGDRVVNGDGQEIVVEGAQNARLAELDGALHDPISGEDTHRHALLDLTLGFFDKHL